MTQSRKTDETNPERTKRADSISPRKVYRRPELSFYGDVSQVTRGDASTHNGDVGGGATKMCWMWLDA